MHLSPPAHSIRDVETEAQREKSTREIIKDHMPQKRGPRHDLVIEARDGAKHFIYIISCNNHKNLIN